MELAVSTGIVEEFPSATTGKIVGSRGFQDLLALKHPIPGSKVVAPLVVSGSYTSVLVEMIVQRPSFFSKRFEDRNHELYVVVDIPDAEFDYYKARRWKARMVMRAKGIVNHYRIDSVQGVPAFWLEEVKDERGI